MNPSRGLMIACFVCVLSLWGGTASAQPKSACEKAVAEALDVWESSPALEGCVAAGDVHSEGMMGMLYWGAARESCAGSDCEDPGAYALPENLTREELLREGKRLLESAATKGDHFAQNELGRAHLDGVYGQAVDPVAARQWLEKSTAGGDDLAPFNLARIYFGGIGVERSAALGEYYLRMSASRGAKEAKCSLLALVDRRQGVGHWLDAAALRLSSALSGGSYCRPIDIIDRMY